MRGITDSKKDAIESITSKWIMPVFTVLLIVLLEVLVLIILSDSATEWFGNILGTQDNKTKTVQFIGWAMGEVSIAIGLVLLIWRAEFRVEYGKFVQQKYVRKIIDFMKLITGKRIIFGFTVLFVVLFAGLMSVIFFNSAAEWVENPFDIKNNKTETIQFIGWTMSGTLAVIGLVVLSRWWVKFQVGLMKKIVDFMKKIINGTTSKRIVVGCVFLLIILFAVLTLVVLFDSVEKWVWDFLFGSLEKTDIIQFIGWTMSGTSFVIGLVAFNRRAEAQVKNNELVEEGHMQDRFKAATEHLGSQKSLIRIAAFYEFLHLANDNKEKYQKSVLEILYAYIRTTTTVPEYGNTASESSEAKTTSDEPKSAEEIQVLLDRLFKSKEIWLDDIKPNLRKVNLSGADLSEADLSEADLSEADLSEANLFKANLPKANLSKAILSGAILSEAILSGANLSGANLVKAKLWNANLSKAKLWDIKLSQAKLREVNLSGASLFRADLLGAYLFRANLSGAYLFGANLSGANLFRANLSGADLLRANLSKANLFGADLSGANLSGADLSGIDSPREIFPKVQLGGVFYTSETIFPEWIVPPIVPPDNGDKVQFPEGFVAPEKPKKPKNDE